MMKILQAKKTIPGSLHIPLSRTPRRAEVTSISHPDLPEPQPSFSKFQLLLKPSSSPDTEPVAILTPVTGVDVGVQVEVQKEVSSYNFVCGTCGAKKRDNHHLRLHTKSMHSGERAPYICERFWCQEEFFTQWEKKEHMKGCKQFCQEPGCPRSHIGMIWRQEIKKHTNFHATLRSKLNQLEE